MADAPVIYVEPDAETACVRALNVALPDLDASGFRAGAPAGRRIIVRKTGGNPLTPAHWTTRLTITCWGETIDDEVTPFADARDVAAVMARIGLAGWLDSVACNRVDVISSPYPDPDPVTGRARYSATYALVLRGSEAPTTA